MALTRVVRRGRVAALIFSTDVSSSTHPICSCQKRARRPRRGQWLALLPPQIALHPVNSAVSPRLTPLLTMC